MPLASAMPVSRVVLVAERGAAGQGHRGHLARVVVGDGGDRGRAGGVGGDGGEPAAVVIGQRGGHAVGIDGGQRQAARVMRGDVGVSISTIGPNFLLVGIFARCKE